MFVISVSRTSLCKLNKGGNFCFLENSVWNYFSFNVLKPNEGKREGEKEKEEKVGD